MNRKEMLRWCYENILKPDNKLTLEDMVNAIGEEYYEELDQMEFIQVWYDYASNHRRVFLTWLGEAYCKEFFE